jgi:type II secretory pathway pseudopilin PulG
MSRAELRRWVRSGRGPAAFARLLDRLRAQHGFTLIELAIASILLLTIGPAVVAVIVSSSQMGAQDLHQSSADALAASKIELIRAMPYDNIGFSGGNPPGTITSSNTLLYAPTTLNGQAISISYSISYVDDHGAQTRTYADYKRIVVTITRTSDSKVLATETTEVSNLTGLADGGSDYVDIRRTVVDMATGNPPLSGVTVNVANGPSANRSDITNSSGAVTFPLLEPNTSSTNFYDVTASLTGYSTYPADLPYSGTGSPATSLEQINHQTGADDNQTIHMYKNGSVTTVNVYKSDGVTKFPSSTTVYMGAGLAGNTGTATVGTTTTATTFSSLLLGNSYVSPSVTSINVYPGNYTFSGESGTISSMTYAVPQTVGVPNNYPSDLTKTVSLDMYASAVTTNCSLTVTVKRSGSTVQNAHVEVSSTNTGNAKAPSVYFWGNTNSSGQVTIIVPQGSNYTVKATDARGSTGSLTSQSYSSSSGTATVTMTP